VYPNPNEGSFNVSFEINTKSSYTLELKNALGQIVYSENLPADFTGQCIKQINIADYSKGIYTLSLTGAQQKINKKIVVN
jgi:hypothetical protein